MSGEGGLQMIKLWKGTRNLYLEQEKPHSNQEKL